MLRVMFVFWLFMTILIAIVGLIAIVFLPGKLKKHRLLRLRNDVIATSERYKKLVKSIDEIGFHKDVMIDYRFSENVKSKSKFDRFNFDSFFKSKISAELDKMEEVITKVKQNIEKFSEYQEIFNDVYNSVTAGTDKREVEYYDMEKKLLLEHRDSVSKTPLFTCFVSYASPQGRNHYENEKTYTLQELISFRDTIILETAEKNSEAYRRKFERGKVTDSLRYDVLTRDGFRCKLCGREANDGVKLEVDHIVPISKGGKTTMSNLQTLCKECNRGKRDKYNECNVNNVGVLNS